MTDIQRFTLLDRNNTGMSGISQTYGVLLGFQDIILTDIHRFSLERTEITVLNLPPTPVKQACFSHFGTFITILTVVHIPNSSHLFLTNLWEKQA